MYIYLNVCKQMTNVKLLPLHSNTCNYLTVCKKLLVLDSNTWNQATGLKQKSSCLLKNYLQTIHLQIMYF